MKSNATEGERKFSILMDAGFQENNNIYIYIFSPERFKFRIFSQNFQISLIFPGYPGFFRKFKFRIFSQIFEIFLTFSGYPGETSIQTYYSIIHIIHSKYRTYLFFGGSK